jgi:ABC-type Mn2+/Zn2+ transport system ATPase subunit
MPGESVATAALVKVRDAAFGYGGRAVVRVDDLRLHPGRCLGVFGPNGAGKTTLVRGVTGLLPPMRGQVIRRGGGQNDRTGDGLRFGYLPQHRTMELNWPMTALDAAALATSAGRRLGWVRDTSQVRRMMDTLGVAPLAGRPFAKLSGGQQQRVLLAGALAPRPDVLVLDEPTDGLDVRARLALLDLLRDFTANGLSTVVISHDVQDLLYLCHEVAWLHAADDAEQPSSVETITAPGLADRMVAQRRPA